MKTGLSSSTTVMACVQLEEPPGADAVQTTFVVREAPFIPAGMSAPERLLELLKLLVMVIGPQLSVAVALAPTYEYPQDIRLPSVPLVCGAGHVITGARLSFTEMVTAQEFELPAPSVAKSRTVCVPVLAQLNV